MEMVDEISRRICLDGLGESINNIAIHPTSWSTYPRTKSMGKPKAFFKKRGWVVCGETRLESCVEDGKVGGNYLLTKHAQTVQIIRV